MGAIFIKFGRVPAIKKTFIVSCSLDAKYSQKDVDAVVSVGAFFTPARLFESSLAADANPTPCERRQSLFPERYNMRHMEIS